MRVGNASSFVARCIIAVADALPAAPAAGILQIVMIACRNAAAVKVGHISPAYTMVRAATIA
jgi:hypothetical protein